MTQRVIPISSPRFIAETHLSPAFRPESCFPLAQPLALEIGCGIGDFMQELAASQPQTNFLAIDIYNQGCLKTCRRADEAGLDNVRVMRIEARHLIARYLDPAALSAIYINCPDPWPKKRHRERRLMNADFLAMLRFALRPGGDLFFVTDVQDYAEQVPPLATRDSGFTNLTATGYTTELPPGYPVSKYMRRFLQQGQPVHYVQLRRTGEDEALLVRPPEIRRGFRVRREAVTCG